MLRVDGKCYWSVERKMANCSLLPESPGVVHALVYRDACPRGVAAVGTRRESLDRRAGSLT